MSYPLNLFACICHKLGRETQKCQNEALCCSHVNQSISLADSFLLNIEEKPTRLGHSTDNPELSLMVCGCSEAVGVNASGIGKSKLGVCMSVCVESCGLSQSESLRAFLNGQQQHMSQLLVALIGWKVQLVKAGKQNKNKDKLLCLLLVLAFVIWLYTFTRCEQMVGGLLTDRHGGFGISECRSFLPARQSPGVELWMCQWQTAGTWPGLPDRRSARPSKTTGSNIWSKT